MRNKIHRLALLVVIALCLSTNAEDALQITATLPDGTVMKSSGPRLLPQLRDLVKEQGTFAALHGQSFDATIRYGDLNHALHLSENAAGTTASLSSQLSNLHKNFTAGDQAQLQSQVTRFFQHGATAYSQYVAAVDAHSVFGLIDGNPRSATAFLAEDAYFRWGEDASNEWTPFVKSEGFDMRLDWNAGAIQARHFSGDYVTGAIGFDWLVSHPVAISLAIPFEYRTLGGSTSYIAGLNFGIPITVIPSRVEGIGWEITPFGSGWGGLSGDLAAGGFFASGGVASSLRFRAGNFEAALANQVSYSGGIPISFAGINYQTEVDQWLLKNGVELSYAVSPAVLLDAALSYSNYTNRAAIPDWWTIQMGANFRFNQSSGLRVGYQGDFGSGYTSNGGTLSLYLRF